MKRKFNLIVYAKSKLNRLLISLGAILVGGILIWLTFGGGTELILDWFKPVKIIASSVSRQNIETFISGEKIRFIIEPIKTEKVIWVFGEQEVYQGGVEMEYAFAYDTSKSEGITIDRRVDAFYKDEGRYRPVSMTVRTQNIKYQANLILKGLKVLLTSMKELQDRWLLDSLYLAKYDSGGFKLILGLKISGVKNQDSIFASISNEKFLQAFNYPKGTDIRTLLNTNPNAWIAYEFIDNKNSERLTIVQNVGNLF